MNMHDRRLLAEVGVSVPPRGDRSVAEIVGALEADVMAIDPAAITVDGVRRSGMSAGWYDEDECPYDVVGNVAVVSVDGPLSQRGGWWYDGYDAIRVRYLAALKDDKVRCVALKLNSPGGVVAGCFEAVKWMRAAKAAYGKPVYAFADEHAYSAAYALACVADEIWLPDSGGVGSIGILGTLVDATKYLETAGLRVAVIGSGKAKGDGHPAKPLTDEILERYRATIMHLADLFAELVSEARGISPDDVLGLEAMTYDGSNARVAGLADGVSSFGEFLRRCDNAAKRAPSRAVATSRTHRGALAGPPVLVRRGGHLTRLR